MNKVAQIFLGLFLGAILGVASFTFYITFTYPNYFRDSGAPPLLPGIILGAPVGTALGILVAVLWPSRR